jgi:hypothetical protein
VPGVHVFTPRSHRKAGSGSTGWGRARRQIRRSERDVQSLLDACEFSTCFVNGDGQIVVTNRAWRQARSGDTGGRLPVDGAYLDIWETATCTNKDVPETIAVGLGRLLAGEPGQLTVDYPCATGESDRWISLRIARLHGVPGAVLSHVSVSAADLSAPTSPDQGWWTRAGEPLIVHHLEAARDQYGHGRAMCGVESVAWRRAEGANVVGAACPRCGAALREKLGRHE